VMTSERNPKRSLSRNVSFSDEEDVICEVSAIDPERKPYVWYKKEEIDRFRVEEQFRAERKIAKRLRKLIVSANNAVAAAAETNTHAGEVMEEMNKAEDTDMQEVPFFSIPAKPKEK